MNSIITMINMNQRASLKIVVSQVTLWLLNLLEPRKIILLLEEINEWKRSGEEAWSVKIFSLE